MVGQSSTAVERWVDLAQALWSCGRTLRRELARHLEGWMLNETQFGVLLACRRGSEAGISQHVLAAESNLSAAQMSGLVEQLRRSGWLIAARDPDDRRVQLWRLSDAGRDQLQRVLIGLFPTARDWDAGMGISEQQLLWCFLERLRELKPGDGPAAPRITEDWPAAGGRRAQAS